MPRHRSSHEKPADIDTMLRHVSRRHPDALPRMLFGIEEPIEEARYVETQVTARQRRVDRALRVKIAGKGRVLHIEWTYRLDRHVGARVYEYNHLLVMGTHTDTRTEREKRGRRSRAPYVDSVVVVLTGRKRRMPRVGLYRTSSKGELFSGIRYRIEAIYQRTVAELFGMGSVFWLAFVPLAVDVDEEKLGRALFMLASATTEQDYADLAGMMVALAHLKKKHQPELLEMIKSHVPRNVVMQNWLYKEGKADGVSWGREVGRQEGRQEGLAPLLHLFARRLGRPITEAEERRIASRLRKVGPNKLGDVALDLSREALIAWLAPNGHRTNEHEAA